MAKKQKSGLYRTKIKIGVDADGKAIVKYISGSTKAELEAERKKVVERYITGTGLEDDRVFGAYAVEWYQVRKEPFIEASTQNCYRTILNKHLIPAFGERNLRSIKPIELQKYVNGFSGQSKTQITMIVSALRNIFESALQDSIIDKNPAAGLRKPDHSTVDEKRALTDEERTRVIAQFRTHKHGLYLAVMYYTGMRPGEVRGLKWGDVDFASGLIHVQRDIDFAAGGKEGKLKTAAAERYIPISADLRELLVQARNLPDAYLFPGVGGKPLAPSTAARMWLELMQACGMVEPIPVDRNGQRVEKQYYSPGDIRGQYRPLITPHAMRHNFITMCWEQGMDIMLTMKLVGHSDYQTTRNIYTHLSQKHMEKARDVMELMFGKNAEVAQKLHSPR